MHIKFKRHYIVIITFTKKRVLAIQHTYVRSLKWMRKKIYLNLHIIIPQQSIDVYFYITEVILHANNHHHHFLLVTVVKHHEFRYLRNTYTIKGKKIPYFLIKH